jgi:hypothetical protein
MIVARQGPIVNAVHVKKSILGAGKLGDAPAPHDHPKKAVSPAPLRG